MNANKFSKYPFVKELVRIGIPVSPVSVDIAKGNLSLFKALS